MTDEEFLQYCELRAEAPSCHIRAGNLARLCYLAGDIDTAKFWDIWGPYTVDCNKQSIKDLVTIARHKILKEPY